MTSRKEISFRWFFFFLMLLGALATLFPDLALSIIQVNVLEARAPKIALQAAQLLFGFGALVFGCVFAAWRWLGNASVIAIRWIARLPDRKFWLLVIASTALIRAVVAFGLPRETLANDAGWYYHAAASLAQGNGLEISGRPTAYRPPVYPFLLSLTQRLFGPDPNLAWFWGILATSILVVTTWHLSRKLYDTNVAKLATLAITIYPALALMTGQTMSELVFLAGLQLLLLFVLSGTRYGYLNACVIGVALGLLTLTRSVAIGLVAIIPGVWFLQRVPIKKMFVPFLILLISFIGILIPWLWRNYSVLGVPTLGTNLGLMAFAGNHPGASGGDWIFQAPPSLRERSRAYSEAEFDRALLGEAIQYVSAHPVDAVLVIPKKFFKLYLLETTAAQLLFQGDEPYPLWEKYGSYGITQLGYLLFLFLFGYRLLDLRHSAHRPKGTQWTGWMIVLYFTMVYMIFLGNDRYRLPILPWMIIESSVLLIQIALEKKQATFLETPTVPPLEALDHSK